MIVRFKDSIKLIGISIICFCAVLVCNLFINYYLDLQEIAHVISVEHRVMYDAQVATSKVVAFVSGGCLLATSVVMLIFYIKIYMDKHKKELGVLKAIGYSNFRLAIPFWVFGFSVFIGAALGFLLSFVVMPLFYETMTVEWYDDLVIHFHSSLLLAFVILPTILFSLIAIGFSYQKLQKPALALIQEKESLSIRKGKAKMEKSRSFMEDLKISTIRSKKAVVFFIFFACFCFSAQIQMSFSMDEIASRMFAIMIFVIGIILACTILFIAITTVISSNSKTIAIMNAFGYSIKECSSAILSCYRPFAYLGFMVGSAYQYGLLKIMLEVVFKNLNHGLDYHFDWLLFAITLVVFMILYEGSMFLSSMKISKISLKKIMLD